MALPVTLITTAYTKDQLICDTLPKIVFAGRSNVGKSTLLNALCRQKLAKVSSVPGKTRSINYYLHKERFYLVDLPGYGYAKASQSDRRSWGALIESFFAGVQSLQLLCVLLDARLPPQPKDLEMITFGLERSLPLCGIITKSDKCSNAQLKKNIQSWEPLLRTPPIVTSGKTRAGIDALEACILTHLPPQ